MRSLTFVLVPLAVLMGAAALFGQEVVPAPELPDPTEESAVMESQLGVVRGVEELNQLQTQLEQALRQNRDLVERLETAREDNQALRAQVEAALSQEQKVQSRRRSIPTMRLVAQLRSDTLRWAEVKVGTTTYRVTEGIPFSVAFEDQEMAVGEVRFVDNDGVEVRFPELETSVTLFYRPSPTAR